MILGLLSFKDLAYAAIIAFFLTYIIIKVSDAVKTIKTGSVELGYQMRDLEHILERCYHLFPSKVLKFQGEIFERGMRIRITTSQRKTYEGRFLGYNSDDMVCLMTKKYIIAYAISNIEEMEQLD